MKKQKSGLYRTAVTVAGQKVWLSAKTKAQLQDKKREIKEKLITGSSRKPMTFHELVLKWWNEIREPKGLSASTVKNDKSMINKFILPSVDKRMLAQAVRRSDLQPIITLLSNGHNSERCAKIKFMLQSICSYGMQLGVMSANYGTNLVVPKDTQIHTPRQAIPEDVIVKLLQVAEGDMITTLNVIVYTGLRRGEAVALTWADIDFDNNDIIVTKSFNAVTRTISTTKTANSIRRVHMPPQLVAVLKKHRGLPSAPVGIDTSARLDYAWVRTLFKAGYATHREGMPRDFALQHYDIQYTIHQLRHSYATRLFAAGVDPITASRMMGHSSYKITADIYTQIDKSTRKKSNDAIDNAFAQDLHNHSENAGG